jgi:hypothetical protein
MSLGKKVTLNTGAQVPYVFHGTPELNKPTD